MFMSRPRAGISPFKGTRPLFVESPSLPRRLVLPLESTRYDEARPLVKVGDRVQAGQVLSEGRGLGFQPQRAPLNGTVHSISRRPILPPPLRDGAPMIPVTLTCVELVDLEDRPHVEVQSAWQMLDEAALRRELCTKGLEGEEGLPLDLEMDMLPQEARLIILAADLEQGWGPRGELLERFPGELYLAVEALQRIHEFHSVIIACGPEQRKEAARLAGMLDKRIDTKVLQLKQGHPWDHPRLVSHAAGFGLPDTERTYAAQGLLFCSTDRLLSLARQLSYGGLPAPAWLQFYRPGSMADSWTPSSSCLMPFWPGTPLSELLTGLIWEDAGPLVAESGARMALCGSWLEGAPWLDLDFPLLPGHRLLHWLPQDWFQPERADACISCGQCLDICPLRLAPVRLMHLIEDRRMEEARGAGLDHCVDCGLCSWVCPSRIPLGHALRKGLFQLKELRDVRV